jgi:hypothetical protein
MAGTLWLAGVHVLLHLSGCGSADRPPAVLAPGPSAARPAAAVAADEPRIRQFCGNCHAMPRPDSFPRDRWYEEVRRGFDFYFQSGRTDLPLPAQTEVVAYFRERAPEQLAWEPESFQSTPSPVRFQRRTLWVMDDPRHVPAVSYLAPHSSGDEPALWVSDMRNGNVSLLVADGTRVLRRIEAARHPVTVWPCELNGNEQIDLVVADLGSFLPEDHQRGRLLWLPDGARDPDVRPVVLLAQVGRVADVRSADFDNDGDEDLVVAEFGWHRTGGIHVVWNDGVAATAEGLAWRSEVLDGRPGTIHVRPIDLNGDGRMDFIALISQEHETVVAFLNRPAGFEKVVLYAAPDPSYGSSGIELCDVDQDGDIDVLYTNGDTFDSELLKPYHAIRWLVNEGSYPFREQVLATMPGVHRALPADMDGDGDLDIVACALVPQKQRDAPVGGVVLEGVLWLEQTASGRFERHPLSTGAPVHAALWVGDLDNDGDHDILTGGFYEEEESEGKTPALLWFENQGASPAASER